MFESIRFMRDHAPADLDAVAVHVGITLAAYASSSGFAEVGVRQLSTATRLHAATITRAIRRLEAAGAIKVDRHANGQRSTYQFPINITPPTAVDYPQPRALVARSGYPQPRAQVEKARDRSARVGQPVGENTRDSVFIPGAGWCPKFEREIS